MALPRQEPKMALKCSWLIVVMLSPQEHLLHMEGLLLLDQQSSMQAGGIVSITASSVAKYLLN
jgi:hypothetical protein